MKTNKMSKWSYLGIHIFYIFICYIWHSNLLFECVRGMTYKESKFILWMVVFITCTVCLVFTFKNNRTSFNAFINVMLSFGIYTFIVLAGMFKRVTIISLSIAALLSLILAYLIFNQKIRRGVDRFKVLRRRAVKWVIGSRVIVALVMVIVTGAMTASILFNDNLLCAKTEAVIDTQQNSEWRISKKVDELSVLRTNEWYKLSMQGKIDVLQIIGNIEGISLGVGHELNVGTKPLKENVLGEYAYQTHTISIDTEFLQYGSVYKVIDTLMHEVRHAYQRRAIEALSKVPEEYYSLSMFYDACLFQNGEKNYGKGGMYGYYSNELEVDARKYAEENVEIFFEELDRCIRHKEVEMLLNTVGKN